MTAEQFIAELEKQGLLPGNVISMLRRLVEDAPTPPTPAALAKTLVEHGQLTPFQAKKFLGEAEARHKPTKAADQPVAKALSPPKTKPSDDLGLTPLDDEGGLAPLDDAAGLTPLTDDLGLAPLDEPKGSPAAKKSTAAPKQTAAKSASQASPAASAAKGPAAKAPAGAAGLTPLGPSEGLAPLDDLLGAPGAAAKPAAGAPLDDLLGDPLLASGAATAGSPLLPASKPKGWFESLFGGAAGAKGPSNPWESPLILIGGGGLLLLCIVGVVLYLTISRGSAQDAFDLAEKDYSDGAYGQAIAKYERFVSNFSGDSHVSLARVRIGMAQLRTAVAAKNWAEALRVAQEALPPLEVEDAFGQARPELVTLLPDIFAGFVEQAAATMDLAQAKELVAQARTAEKLVANPVYLPTSERKAAEARIALIQGQLAEVEHVLLRDDDLKKALADIETAVAAGKTSEAYEIRRGLLRAHPTLAKDDGLRKAVLQISAKERERVTPIAEPLAAATADHPQVAASRILVSSRSGEVLAAAQGYVTPVLAAGSIFGIDAANGAILWRRAVGAETTIPPRNLSSDPGADVLAVDQRRQELLRLAAADGHLVWRLPLSEPFFAPVLAGDKVFLATRGGRVLVVDPATGSALRQVRIPQALAAAPALNSTGSKVYVAAEHTNLYSLAADTLACTDVTYLGHATGSIAAPAAVAVGYVVVPENLGSDVTLLHLCTAAEGETLTEVAEPLRLKGHVRSAAIVSGKFMIWCTDRGDVQVYEVTPAKVRAPLTAIGNQVGSYREPVFPYPLLDGTRLWLAGIGLTRNEVQTPSSRLVRQLAADERDAFDGPLTLVAGEVLVSIRRRADLPGVTVAATRVAATPNAAVETRHAWETHLAVPLVAPPQALAEQRKIVLATALGQFFELGSPELQAGRVDRPVQQVAAAAPLRVEGCTELTGAARLFSTRAADAQAGGGLLRYDPSDAAAPLRPFAVPKPGLAPAARPVRWGKGVVVPLAGGQIALLDGDTGAPLAAPYQAPVEFEQPRVWQSLAAADDPAVDFAAVDSAGAIHRVGLQAEPAALLVSRGTKSAGLRPESPVALVGATLWTVTGEANDLALQPFAWPELTPETSTKLTGPLLWGPTAVGDVALVATGTEVHCLEAGGKVRWTLPIEHRLAGPATSAPEGLLIALSSGVVRLVSVDKGAILSEIDLGEPLASGAALFNGRVLVSAADGTLLMSPWKKP